MTERNLIRFNDDRREGNLLQAWLLWFQGKGTMHPWERNLKSKNPLPGRRAAAIEEQARKIARGFGY